MTNVRLIAKLDIKGSKLIKGIRYEGVRVIGDPQAFAQKYYQDGIDELIYIDTVASLYNRISLFDLVEKTVKDVFIPLTVGGGIRTVEDVDRLLRSGADKIAINTEAVKNPDLISKVARKFGSQCMVLSIQACKQEAGFWEAYTDCGREHSGLNAVDWAIKGEELGAGEILLTSVDRDGTCKGYDIDLVKNITKSVNIPVIATGGMGHPQNLVDVIKKGDADAVAMGHILHYAKLDIIEIKQYCKENGISTR